MGALFCFIVLGLAGIEVCGIMFYCDPEGAMSLFKGWEVPAKAETSGDTSI